MLTVSVNYLAVLVAAIVAMVIGGLWYSPMLFGNIWMRLSGLSGKDMKKAKEKGMAKSYLLTFIGSLVAACVLATLLGMIGATNLTQALQLACLLWVGFFVTSALSSVLWEGKPWALYLINVLCHLVTLIVTALILVSWP